MPKRKKIDLSPHRDQIVEWMKDHLSMTTIRERCKNELGFDISRQTLNSYRNMLMPGQMLPTKYIHEKLEEVEYLTDEMSRFSLLIIAQEKRFRKLLSMENEAVEQGVMLYAQQTDVSKGVSEVARDYLQMLLKFIAIKQSLGLLELTPQKLDIRGMILSGKVADIEIPEEIRRLTDAELLAELNKEVIDIEYQSS